ncbi:hypothetical protein VTJ83DRAFT_3763 [Remersonia thermophila]|uniref:Serum paraoxonase/arylesterase 2 n=1 Tax=Remersonia thermophila TaxID=72144 RepID=A0ABR4DF81_9PEZI
MNRPWRRESAAAMRSLTVSLLGALLAYLLYSVGPHLQRAVVVLGVFRKYPPGAVAEGQVTVIPDTVHCEDLHYYAPSGTIFTACEDDASVRFRWFPPLANFDDPELGGRSQGSIHVIDPKTFTSQRLQLEGFKGAFVTHGIDVIADPDAADGKAVYIIAINHLPETQPGGKKGPRARSQLEIFRHVLGSSSAQHLRSVWHPLVRTPNDVFARSPSSIYVSNDHRHRDHGLMRTIEDLYYGSTWGEIVHLQLGSVKEAAADPSDGVTARIVLTGLHNTNGLGHGRTEDEIVISSAASGVMHLGRLLAAGDAAGNITVVESVDISHVADNPSYFADPYATADDDRSGFLETGVSRAIHLAANQRDPAAKDPVMVTYMRPVAPGRWEKRVLFDDDGTRLRTASGGVLVALDPKEEDGKRKAWLFVSGFMSQGAVALKVDL